MLLISKNGRTSEKTCVCAPREFDDKTVLRKGAIVTER